MARLRYFVFVCGSSILLGVWPGALVLMGPPLRAESTFQWTSRTGGLFSDRANWLLVGGDTDVAPPDGDDVALFSLDATYGVSFDTSPINAALQVTGGDITFRPSNTTSRQYTLEENALLQGGSLTIAGNTAFAAATMTIVARGVQIGEDSTLILRDGGVVATSTGVIIGNNGTVTLAHGKIRVGEPAAVHLESGGLLTGVGMVDGDLVSEGRVDPSNLGSPGGELKVIRNYTQTQRGTLQINLGGAAQPTADSLSVTGHVNLSGILEIVAPRGFTLMPGMEFHVLSYDSREGGFDHTVNSTSSRGVYFDVEYDDADGTGTVRVTALPGDIDLDGDVDRRDAALFAPNLGASGGNWLTGDFDADGWTTMSDLAAQQAHMGMSIPSPSPMPIPEPPAVVSALVALAAMMGAARCRAHHNRLRCRM